MSDEMFLNSFYTIKRIQREGNSNKLSVLIRLNPSHEIFKGHFPGNPILPGVCIIQILKEILMYQINKNLALIHAGSIKYFSIINPEINSKIKFDIELKEIGNYRISCNAFLYSESDIICRFKGVFQVNNRDSHSDL